MYFTFLGTVTVFNFEFLNAVSPIVLRLDGKAIFSSFDFLSPKSNAPSTITVVPFLTFTLFLP